MIIPIGLGLFAVSGQDTLEPFHLLHSGFDLFRQGEFENSGHNLYVSKQGRIQFIRHWDLNQDGFYDLVFNTTHNRMDVVDTFVYLQTDGGFHSAISPLHDLLPLYERWRYLERTRGKLLRLEAVQPSAILVQDLNRDGYPEIVLANATDGFTTGSTSYLYWGSREGYSERTDLPTAVASDVCSADLNQDGWPDIVFANRGRASTVPAPPRLRDSSIYWGSPQGYGPDRRTPVKTKAARSCTTGDLDADGHPDLIIAHEDQQRGLLSIFWGAPQGPDLDHPTDLKIGGVNRIRFQEVRPWGPVLVVAGEEQLQLVATTSDRRSRTVQSVPLKAWGVAVAEVDGDGRDELVVASAAEGKILWGGRQFELDSAQSLPALSPRDVLVTDLNQDGRADIVLANHQSEKTFDVASYIYWGNREGWGPHRRQDLQTFGAAAAAAGDVNRDGRPDLLFANGSSAFVKGPDTRENALVYWGMPHRGYSPSQVTRYPINAAMGSLMADLDDDGYAELLFANMADFSFLYPGTENGPDPNQVQTLVFLDSDPHNSFEVADLNRDGYLDVLLSGLIRSDAGGRVMTLWGGPSGISARRSSVLDHDLKGMANLRLADLDRDGRLDLFLAGTYDQRSAILWRKAGRFLHGSFSAAGGALHRKRGIRRSGPGRLPRSGVVQERRRGLYNYRAGSRIRVRFGGPDGFFGRETLELAVLGAIDLAVADLNRDSYLDLIVAQYSAGDRADIPALIFWNDGEGGYSPDRVTEIPALASCGLLAADFDADSWNDLLVVNHIDHGNHNVDSFLYWGAHDGFSPGRRTALPSPGPHWTQNTDIGNLVTRQLRESYLSVAVPIPGSVKRLQVSSQAETPLGSRIELQVRSATTREALLRADWVKPDDDDVVPLAPRASWLQYRATLVAGSAGNSPYLKQVEIRETQ